MKIVVFEKRVPRKVLKFVAIAVYLNEKYEILLLQRK